MKINEEMAPILHYYCYSFGSIVSCHIEVMYYSLNSTSGLSYKRCIYISELKCNVWCTHTCYIQLSLLPMIYQPQNLISYRFFLQYHRSEEKVRRFTMRYE